MKKKLFIESIDALKKQYEYDKKVSKNLGKIFPNAFEANLLPDNHYLSDALIKILQEEMNDTEIGEDDQSWIEYFCFELNFGSDYEDGMIQTKDGKNIDFSDSSKLWEFLNNQ